MNQVPDWITAVSTAVTAIAAIAAGIVAYVAYRSQTQPALPVIEPDFTWEQTRDGSKLRLLLVVRNQLYETIVLEHIAIKKPRHMTFAAPRQELEAVPQKATSMLVTRLDETHERQKSLDWEISPLGTTHRSPFDRPANRADVARRDFYMTPPTKWDGGTVEIELRFLSKALTIRPRTTAIKRLIPSPPKLL